MLTPRSMLRLTSDFLQELCKQVHTFLPVSIQGNLLHKRQLVAAIVVQVISQVANLQCVSEHPKHGSPGTANYIDARTTWFDWAVEGAKQSGLSQVVIIAAGFDSRAYRLHQTGLQVCCTCPPWTVRS